MVSHFFMHLENNYHLPLEFKMVDLYAFKHEKDAP